MLWIINGLIYGFFMALYTLVNQKRNINGYVLGVWRGFGIFLLFAPLLFFIPLLQDWRNWVLLLFQGVLIGIYDSHIFFASARFGANNTSRLLVLSVLFTTILWWLLTPRQFILLFKDANVFITLLLSLIGFCICYWYMLKSKITKEAFYYMLPATVALALMSIATKEIAVMRQNVWYNIIYYLTVSTFISGCYNFFLLITTRHQNSLKDIIFAKPVMQTGIYIIGFSAALITAKTLALRLSPNPGYVVTLLLIAPIFVYILSPHRKSPNQTSEKAGWAMLFFLSLIMLLTGSHLGVND